MSAVGLREHLDVIVVRKLALLVLLVLAGCARTSAGDEYGDLVPANTAPGAEDRGLVPGDTGPGGGIVFLIAEEPFPCGVAGDRLCRYLEVAPQEAERKLAWSADTNRDTSVPGAHDISLGAGLENSLLVVRQTGNAPSNSAAAYAAAYERNGYDDWYLPSADALNELCKYARALPAGTFDDMCDENGSLRDGFSAGTYWSSSEASESSAWLQNLEVGNSIQGFKDQKYIARPIRSF